MSSSTRTTTDPSATATTLANTPDLWQPLVDHDPVSRFYARLARTDEYEAWLLTWLPGQGTDWHDHGGSAGAFVVVAGSLREEHARPLPDGDAEVTAVRRLDRGALRPFGSRPVHRVTSTGLEPAVSIHVYAPALTRMNGYVREGDRLRLVESRLAGVAW